MDMRVDWNRRPFETIDQDTVGCFPADRGKLQQLIHLIRNSAVVFFQDYPGHSLDCSGLGLVKADWLN